MTKNEKITIVVRITKDLKQKLMDEAKKEKRNFSNMVNVILEHYFE